MHSTIHHTKAQQERIRAEFNKSQIACTSHWRSVCSVVLTFKQAMEAGDGRYVCLDEFLARKNFRHFMRVLNRAVYKGAARNHNKRLRVIPVLEKSEEGRYHYNAAIELPAHLTPEQFEQTIIQCWRRTHFGNREMHFGVDKNEFWTTYMLKERQKSGLEHWFDTIDLDQLFNPN